MPAAASVLRANYRRTDSIINGDKDPEIVTPPRMFAGHYTVIGSRRSIARGAKSKTFGIIERAQILSGQLTAALIIAALILQPS